MVARETTRAMSIIVHGESKAGKSTFGNTTVAPRLILDGEMAYRFLTGTKTFWDPTREEPPVYDGTWESCIVLVRDYMSMQKAYEWLNSGQHPFRSVTIDSISEIQSRFKDDLTAAGKMSQQLWGDLLHEMDKLVRGFRDLTEHPTHPIEQVVLTAMTQLKNNKYRPYVQGQLQVKLPYFMDVIGYLYVEAVQSNPDDPTSPVTRIRRLLVEPHDMFEAGERVGGKLGSVVTNPNMNDMMTTVFGPEAKDNEKKEQSS